MGYTIEYKCKKCGKSRNLSVGSGFTTTIKYCSKCGKGLSYSHIHILDSTYGEPKYCPWCKGELADKPMICEECGGRLRRIKGKFGIWD